MELHESLEYDADPGTVFAMLCDKSWREDVCRDVHALSFDVSVRQEGDAVVIRTKRTMPAEVPDAVKRFVGDTIVVEQVETWGPAGTDGRRCADLVVDVKGKPAGMVGTVTLEPVGGKSHEVIRGDVTVRIPFVGGRIEPEIVKAIRAAIRVEGEAGRVYLDG
jgi:hypothetical protein